MYHNYVSDPQNDKLSIKSIKSIILLMPFLCILYEKILSLGYIKIKQYQTEQDMFYFFNGNRISDFFLTNKYIFPKRVSQFLGFSFCIIFFYREDSIYIYV